MKTESYVYGEATYYPPVGSCDYDEHENDVYFIGDAEVKDDIKCPE